MFVDMYVCVSVCSCVAVCVCVCASWRFISRTFAFRSISYHLPLYFSALSHKCTNMYIQSSVCMHVSALQSYDVNGIKWPRKNAELFLQPHKQGWLSLHDDLFTGSKNGNVKKVIKELPLNEDVHINRLNTHCHSPWKCKKRLYFQIRFSLIIY